MNWTRRGFFAAVLAIPLARIFPSLFRLRRKASPLEVMAMEATYIVDEVDGMTHGFLHVSRRDGTTTYSPITLPPGETLTEEKLQEMVRTLKNIPA
jgi:hypothetical protein